MNRLFSITAILCVAEAAHAQWQPDVRLTHQVATSLTPFGYKSVAASGSVLHAVWYDERDGNFEVYYKRSPDSGASWGADTRLTNNTATSWFASAAVSGSLVHVIWMDDRDGNFEIYYKRSIDEGLNWSGDLRLTNNPALSRFPSITVSGPVVSVVWQDHRDGNPEIYNKRSVDEGLSWGPDIRLTQDSADSVFPSVSSSGSMVNVVWEESRDGNGEVYNKHSTDGGLSWSADTRLTMDPAISFSPNVWASGTNLHVVWYDRRDSNIAEIYYKRSLDGGLSWGIDTRLTNNVGGSFHPSVTASGSNVHVVWYDDRDGNNEAYYKRSTDAGLSWSNDLRLTVNGSDSTGTSVAVSGQSVHVLWMDTRDGNREIYHKRNPEAVATPSAGRVPLLLLDKAPLGDILLSWSVSCSSDAQDYAIYEGTLDTWYSHTMKDCSSAAPLPLLAEQLTPAAGSSYYLVVPLAAASEGSYGLCSARVCLAGDERPDASAAGGTACLSQALGPCP